MSVSHHLFNDHVSRWPLKPDRAYIFEYVVIP